MDSSIGFDTCTELYTYHNITVQNSSISLKIPICFLCSQPNSSLSIPVNLWLDFLPNSSAFFFFFKNGTYIGNKQQFAKSYLTLFVTPWTVARQAPLSMRFPRQEYRSGLAFLPSGYLSNPEIKPMSPTFTDRIFTT